MEWSRGGRGDEWREGERRKGEGICRTYVKLLPTRLLWPTHNPTPPHRGRRHRLDGMGLTTRPIPRPDYTQDQERARPLQIGLETETETKSRDLTFLTVLSTIGTWQTFTALMNWNTGWLTTGAILTRHCRHGYSGVQEAQLMLTTRSTLTRPL